MEQKELVPEVTCSSCCSLSLMLYTRQLPEFFWLANIAKCLPYFCWRKKTNGITDINVKSILTAYTVTLKHKHCVRKFKGSISGQLVIGSYKHASAVWWLPWFLVILSLLVTFIMVCTYIYLLIYNYIEVPRA